MKQGMYYRYRAVNIYKIIFPERDFSGALYGF